jgi:hypothetical protein
MLASNPDAAATETGDGRRLQERVGGLLPTSRACTGTILAKLSKSGSPRLPRPKRIVVWRVMAGAHGPPAPMTPGNRNGIACADGGAARDGAVLISRAATAAGLEEFVRAERGLPLT